MKAIGKTLSIVMALGLLALAGYATYHYVLPKWVPILFYLYVGLGCVNTGIGIAWIVSQDGNSGGVRGRITKIVGSLLQEDTLMARIARLRSWIAAVARLIASTIVWPVDALSGHTLFKGNPGASPAEVGVRLNLRLSEPYYSLYALAVTLVVVGLELRGVDLGGYGKIVLYLMLVSTTMRHLRYSVDTIHLPAVLRRVSANPYLIFLTMILTDFSTLIICLTATGAPGSLSAVTFGDLRNTANQILLAQEPLKFIRGARLDEHQAIVGVVGLLLDLALLKAIREYREFQRNDEDQVWLASAANSLGNFASANRCLGKLKSWNSQARAVEVVALIGVNEIDLAEQKVKQFLSDNKLGNSAEQVFQEMWEACVLFPVPVQIEMALLQRAVRLNVRDAMVQDTAAVANGDEGLQKAMLEAFTPVKDRYPLTVAKLLTISGRRLEVLDVLKDAKFPALLDEVIGLVLQMTAIVTDPDTSPEADSLAFRNWAQLALPKLRELMKLVEPWERSVTFQQLLTTLMIAQKLAPDRVEELTFLRDKFKDETQGEQASRGIRALEMQFKKLAASA